MAPPPNFKPVADPLVTATLIVFYLKYTVITQYTLFEELITRVSFACQSGESNNQLLFQNLSKFGKLAGGGIRGGSLAPAPRWLRPWVPPPVYNFSSNAPRFYCQRTPIIT